MAMLQYPVHCRLARAYLIQYLGRLQSFRIQRQQKICGRARLASFSLEKQQEVTAVHTRSYLQKKDNCRKWESIHKNFVLILRH